MIRDALIWLRDRFEEDRTAKIQELEQLDSVLVNGQFHSLPLPNRLHTSLTVPSFCDAIKTLQSEEYTLVWISREKIVAVLDDNERRRNRITLPLGSGRVMDVLDGLVNQGSWHHADLAKILDILVPNYLTAAQFNAFASITTITKQSHASGKSSMDREIESAARQELEDNLPRTIKFNKVSPFDPSIVPLSLFGTYDLVLQCRADAENGTFRFFDTDGALDAIRDSSIAMIKKYIEESCDAEVAVYIGHP